MPAPPAGTIHKTYDAQGNVMTETDEEVDVSGSAVARYSQTQNIDEPLAMLRSGATSYYQADGLGSITSLSNAVGALAQTYTLDSFGKQIASSGPLTNSFRYTAREFDTETNLHFYRARYYDASVGRFIGEDPARFDAKQINFYTYVSNNPIRFADPNGMEPSGACPQFDSVTRHHVECQKLPTLKDRCACHAVYLTDPGYQEFLDSCNACGKKDPKPRDICLCTCNAIKKFAPDNLNKTCDTFCKLTNPVKQP